MNPHVLILSGIYDFSTDMVVWQLKRMGVPYIRLNREALDQYRLALDPVKRICTVTGEGLNAEIQSDSLVSVHYRQPVFLRNTPAESLTPTDQLVERSQWMAFLRSLSVFDSAMWMNYPQATYLAECKPYQLLTAHRCGFQVPETIATNDAGSIIARFTGDLAIKSLDTVLLRDGKDCLFNYMSKSNVQELTDANVASAPLLAQQLFSKKADIRVTIVGNRVFAVRILADGVGIEGDWRLIPREELSYEDVELGEEVERSCARLTRTLGLSFAAIDLVQSNEGISFLEVNPTGEWGWLSNSERRIDRAIASWLAEPG